MSGPRGAAALGALALTGATLGAVRGVEPLVTWYYPLAWFSTLLLADATLAWRERRFFFLGRPAFLATLLLWSAPFWLLFEMLNLRLGNWFYVFVPADPVARRTGILLSFATVLPAVLGAERLLDSFGVARGTRLARLPVGRRLPAALQALGALQIALALAWPRAFFPLVWGGVTLIADPWVYRRDPEKSLLGDLERGRPGRPLRLLLGGLAIGLLWETYNWPARGRWIYTVPGFEDLKLFEMPLAGFLGFPVFALEAFATWQALVVAGLTVPRAGRPWPAPAWARAAVAVAGVAFTSLALLSMERGNVASVTPRLAALPGVPTGALQASGLDAFALARADPDRLAAALDVDRGRAAEWVEVARLATLRGIGAERAARLRALGIDTIADLARADPGRLAERLGDDSRAGRARVRVWVRAARAEVDDPRRRVDAARPPASGLDALSDLL